MFDDAGRHGAMPKHFPYVFLQWYAMPIYSRRGANFVIYLIYKDGEILVETDDLEYVRRYMSKNQECSVRDARTGKNVAVD